MGERVGDSHWGTDLLSSGTFSVIAAVILFVEDRLAATQQPPSDYVETGTATTGIASGSRVGLSLPGASGIGEQPTGEDAVPQNRMNDQITTVTSGCHVSGGTAVLLQLVILSAAIAKSKDLLSSVSARGGKEILRQAQDDH